MRFVTFSLLLALVTPALAEPATNPAAATQPVSDTLAAVRKVQITGDPVKQFPDYIEHIASDVGLQVLGTRITRTATICCVTPRTATTSRFK